MSALESTFAAILRGAKIRGFVREYRFHPKRRFRFDFAHVQQQVAVEIDGGVWMGGRHTRGKGFISDCEKVNLATALGWRVFRFATIEAMAEFPSMYRQLTKGG